MTRKASKYFVEEISSEPPKKIYSNNETNVYYVDNRWSLDI